MRGVKFEVRSMHCEVRRRIDFLNEEGWTGCTHRGRVVSLLFDIRSLFNHRWTQINTDEGKNSFSVLNLVSVLAESFLWWLIEVAGEGLVREVWTGG
jgi:hypothetical protein